MSCSHPAPPVLALGQANELNREHKISERSAAAAKAAWERAAALNREHKLAEKAGDALRGAGEAVGVARLFKQHALQVREL